MPADLEAVTTAGDEADPEAAGLSPELIDEIWDSALGLYRSGVHPALQLCLRRQGEVVLDRAIGHARGNGPERRRRRAQGPRPARDPVLRLLDLEGDHGAHRPHADRARRAGDRRPGRAPHPRVRPPRQGGDHDRPRARPPRRGRLAAARGARPRPAWRPRAPGRADLRREADLGPGQAARLSRGLRRLHPRRGGRAGHRAADRRPACGRDPRAARLPLGQLRGRARGRRRGRAQLRQRPATAAPGLEPRHPGARGADRRGDRVVQRPPVPHRLGSLGELGHDRERALALLRDLPPRGRARRGPGDEARDPAPGAGASSRGSRSTSR